MNTPLTTSSVVSACALLLLACKPDIDPKVIEAQRARVEARCDCVKQSDYAGCTARVDAEHPVPRLEDGYGVKYSNSSLEQYDALVKMSIDCSELANRARSTESP
ncbi:MAG: hypothetical protein H0T76_28645 [Nannocystis sp.]|nr:hypothetical protein [Nannocystis sp.]MBA3550463.1 hypothetical protein [Nannocystis sp.]